MTTIDKIRAEIERLKKYAEESKKDWINEGYNQNAFAEDCRITSFNKLLSFLDTLEEQEQPTCKSCGFYENNCPYIRGKYIPYPNKVCIHYAFSIQKAEDEQMFEMMKELDEKIAKASKSWKGVDVDEYMDEVRGREPVSEDFVEEVRQYYSNNCTWDALKQPMLSIITRCARHFAEWGAEHLKK